MCMWLSLIMFLFLVIVGITYADNLWKPASPLDIKLVNYGYDGINHTLKLLFMIEYPHPQFTVSNISMIWESENIIDLKLYFMAYSGPVIQVITYDYLPVVIPNVTEPSREYMIKLFINDRLKYIFKITSIENQTIAKTMSTYTVKERTTYSNTTTTTPAPPRTITTTIGGININGSSINNTTTTKRIVETTKYELILSIITILVVLTVLGGLLYIKK
jgi:hypothetical protein